jgi:hypothetical protein
MNKSNTAKLFLAFPELYRGREKLITESLMAFDFECGDGWYDIIYRLSHDLTKIAKDSGIEVPEVRQVKEKLGGLRFYTGAIPNAIPDGYFIRIDQAEDESECTCETCGEPGSRQEHRGWVVTLCDKCTASNGTDG